MTGMRRQILSLINKMSVSVVVGAWFERSPPGDCGQLHAVRPLPARAATQRSEGMLRRAQGQSVSIRLGPSSIRAIVTGADNI